MKKTGGDKGAHFFCSKGKSGGTSLFSCIGSSAGSFLLGYHFWLMGKEHYQLKRGKNCKGLIYSFISLGKTLRDWSKQGNTYLITWGWRDFGVTIISNPPYYITIHAQNIQNIPWRDAPKRLSHNRFLVHVFYGLFLLILFFMFVTL